MDLDKTHQIIIMGFQLLKWEGDLSYGHLDYLFEGLFI
jgi:hypothetical protein